MLSEQETADFLEISKITLRNWRWTGKGPAYRKAGGKVFYTQADIDEWINSRPKIQPGKEAK